MNQLSPQARRLFKLAQGADDPGELERARVAQLLTDRLARGAGSATMPARTSAAAKLLGASLKPALLALGAMGALIGAGLLASPRGGAISSTGPAAPATGSGGAGSAHSAAAASAAFGPTADRANGADRQPVERSARSEAGLAKPGASRRATSGSLGAPARASTADSAEADDPAPNLPTRGRFDEINATDERRDASSNTKVDPSARAVIDPLRAEAEALREAQRALRNGQAQRALELLAAQDARFAGGLLAEERAAARVLSLCQAGLAPGARLEAARFAARWPRSALLSRVQAACPR
jgi:hypothetical protein